MGLKEFDWIRVKLREERLPKTLEHEEFKRTKPLFKYGPILKEEVCNFIT